MTRHHYPQTIAKFTTLAGGQYGTADLLALNDHVLELRLGGDYVQFSRTQATELYAAVDRFLDLGEGRRGEHERHERDSDRAPIVEEQIVRKVEETIEVRERDGRRKRR